MNIPLNLHVLGAIFTIAAITFTVFRMPLTADGYKNRIKLLIGVGIYQIVTGAVLIAITPNLNLPAFCIKGLVYLGGLGAIIAYLARKQTQLEQHDN